MRNRWVRGEGNSSHLHLGNLLSKIFHIIWFSLFAPLRRKKCNDVAFSCRMRLKASSTICEGNDHVVVSFPMPHGEIESALVKASSNTLSVEANGRLLLAGEFGDGVYRANFAVSVRVRHLRRLPTKVDASRGFAVLDEEHRVLLVHLPKLTLSGVPHGS